MASPSRLVLAPFGVAYGVAVRARLALYRAGLLKVYGAGVPVVSVGNITAGGTGKTPLVEWLARALATGAARRVCVLTRGYARADEGRRVVVSDGETLSAGAREGGDEPRLLAERLLADKVAVVCDADRVAASRWARENLRSEVFILDDGFQHLRLARDLNVVTLDATDPWGGGRLLPAGRLREPPSGLARADCVVITRAELCGDIAGLKSRAARLSGGRPVHVARTVVRGVRELSREASDESAAPQARTPREPLFAFCAVGNPGAFFAQLRREGYGVGRERAFKDHHSYTQSDADSLSREAERAGGRSLVTTAKDAVKLRDLRFGLPCYVLEIGLSFDEEDALLELVLRVVRRGRADQFRVE
jgi:tetraacyldisaccharide 4'-kinase